LEGPWFYHLFVFLFPVPHWIFCRLNLLCSHYNNVILIMQFLSSLLITWLLYQSGLSYFVSNTCHSKCLSDDTILFLILGDPPNYPMGHYHFSVISSKLLSSCNCPGLCSIIYISTGLIIVLYTGFLRLLAFCHLWGHPFMTSTWRGQTQVDACKRG